jgi:hypothetical protein
MPWQRGTVADSIQLEQRGVTSHEIQAELLDLSLIQKASIIAKLLEIGADDVAEPLQRCHTYQGFAQCTGCKAVKPFWNRCENFYCPTCAPTLSAERKTSIDWWAREISQPKHITLTARNTALITWQRVKSFKAALTKLRRRAFAKNWKGGCWSLEVTNEGRGWHLHAHLLVNVHWVDIGELCRTWGELVGQDYAICSVKDARGDSYLKQVCKYVVKGSDIAKWSPMDIVAFVNAFQGQRTFGVFGQLYGKRTQYREWLDTLTTSRRTCKCGCDKWQVFDAEQWKAHLHHLAIITGTASIPPPTRTTPSPQFELIPVTVAYPR